MLYDALIVGQGIAGSLLAWQMLDSGKSVLIVDNHHEGSSTRVSGGLINPLTGQRLVITPQYDLFYTQANALYAELASVCGKKFIEHKPIIRIFKNNEEKERCKELMQKPAFALYFKSLALPGALGKSFIDLFGSVEITSGGHCYATALLESLREYFLSKKMLITGFVKSDDLTIKNDHVDFKGSSFKQVIFCEGFQAHANHFFEHLPYNHVKGEVLQVKIDAANLPDAIFCQSKWLIPLESGLWLAGSNYNRQEYNVTPTPEAAYEILQGLRQFVSSDISIHAHHAGVRPVVLDQMPVIGMHPKHPAIGIFNGFGSKGFLMVPFFAKLLANHLNGIGNIPKEVDIKRFKC